MNPKLWTRTFTIITVGSIISMLGNSVSGFALGLLVLDYTKSTFLYAFYLVAYNFPKMCVPLIAGPYIDKFSRRKIIYRLDFLSAGLYFVIFFIIQKGLFQYSIFLVVTLVIGTIDGIYTVAYESLYPNLISEGNYSKAYSISSMIYPLATCMVPIASLVYTSLGTVAPLFLFNSISFFLAACFETRIDYKEKHLEKKIKQNSNEEKGKNNTLTYKEEFREGIRYITGEKGLLVIAAYFCVTMFATTGASTLILPFFKNNAELFSHIPINVVTLYTFVTGLGVFGRLIGGLIHYKFKYPTNRKFTIAIVVYITVTVLEALYLYLPIPPMIFCFFLTGIFAVTSFNIRISATQSYIPDEKRGRFNGIFQMVTMGGGMIGQLFAGAMAEWMPERSVIVIFMAINMLAIFFIMYKGKEHVKLIYNREV